MKPVKILFLGLGYSDVADESGLYTELVEELSGLGADIQVVAPALDDVRVGPRVEGGIPVLRVQSGRLFETGLIRKGLNNLLLPLRYYRALRAQLESWNPDWVITPTPPITLTPLVWWMKRRTEAKSYLVLRDIFPQNAVDLGFMSKRGPTHLFFRLLEKWTYSVSDAIGCMSPGNARYVTFHNAGFDSSKLHLLPNWIAERHLAEEAEFTATRERWGVGEQELLCVFGGNLGKPQQVEFLAEVARALPEGLGIKIIVIGKGTESANLKSLIQRFGLTNLVLRDRLPRDEYQQLLGAADVGFILLSERFTIPNIPSRLTGYWAAGVPVLAATDANTDLHDAFLRPYNAGEWVQMGDVSGFIAKLRWFAEHREEAAEMGRRGQQAIRHHFTAKKAAQTVLEQISSL